MPWITKQKLTKMETKHTSLEEAKANTKLIASAPELLKASREMNKALRGVPAGHVPLCVWDALRKLNEAVLKATI